MIAKKKLRILVALLIGIAMVLSIAVSQADGYPTRLVNGFFDYPDLLEGTLSWAYIGLDGNYNRGTTVYTPIPGWNAASFGWNATEIQLDISGNVYGEICARPTDTVMYQDIQTTPGAIYKWRLRHSSRTSAFNDSMQVLIGSPSNQTAQLATRLNSNGLPIDVTNDGIHDTNQAGWQGYTIITPSSNTLQAPWSHEADWEFYEGTYEPPTGQTITRFTYQAVAFVAPAVGNAIDNVEFTMAFPLYYHSDATTGSRPDPEGKLNYRGVYFENETVTIAQNPGGLAREGYIFYGWTQVAPSTGNDWFFNTQADADTSGMITSLVMPASVQHVYAVWYEDPTAEPTATPTAEPTATPTAAPTSTPTATPTVDPTATPVSSDVPKTGDDNHVALMLIGLSAGFSLILAAVIGLRRNQKSI